MEMRKREFYLYSFSKRVLLCALHVRGAAVEEKDDFVVDKPLREYPFEKISHDFIAHIEEAAEEFEARDFRYKMVLKKENVVVEIRFTGENLYEEDFGELRKLVASVLLYLSKGRYVCQTR